MLRVWYMRSQWTRLICKGFPLDEYLDFTQKEEKKNLIDSDQFDVIVYFWTQIVPLLIPMAFVTGLCTFSLVRNILSNPAVRYVHYIYNQKY